MFAIVLVSVEDPEKIVAVRNGPPIVIGLGQDEFFVASDITAILAHTRDMVFLGDEEMAIITRSGVEFTDYSGRAVSKTTQRVLWGSDRGGEGGTSTSCSRKSMSSRPPRATPSWAASRRSRERSSCPT
jgi:glucosamine--fructose-6-phosphate aminotransferase (isomerizing)